MLPITVFPRFQQSYVGTVDDQLVGHSIIAEDVMVIFWDGKKGCYSNTIHKHTFFSLALQPYNFKNESRVYCPYLL